MSKAAASNQSSISLSTCIISSSSSSNMDTSSSSATAPSKKRTYEKEEEKTGVKRGKGESSELVFADPTFDITFKMLFGSEQHKDILISLINNLLNFHGNNQVKQVELLSNDLPVEHAGHIKTILDVRCQTNKGEEILVEMQRQQKDYFLPRTQHYMARILSLKMRSGESDQFHDKLPQIYMLIISRDELFIKDYHIENDELYEKTVVPMIMEKGIVVPGNVMHWKYYEIKKFARLRDCDKIKKLGDGKFAVKEQWLDFLDQCKNATEIPDGIELIIKKAYEIMKKVNWTPHMLDMYYKAIERENDEKHEQAEKVAAAAATAAAAARQEEKFNILLGIKQAIKMGMNHANLLQIFFRSFQENELTKIETHLKEHPDCTDNHLAALLGLSSNVHDTTSNMQLGLSGDTHHDTSGSSSST